MAKRVRRVPVTVDSKGIVPLSEEDIRTILRGADELIMSGGRSLLAKVLKGSRQKAVLAHDLQYSPAFGAFRDLPLEKITARIDWMLENDYLAIEYDYRLPLLVYTRKGWELERPIYADELLGRLDRVLAEQGEVQEMEWFTERNPEVLLLVIDQIAATANPKYLRFLKRWRNKASRRLSKAIGRAVHVLQQGT